MPLVGQVAEVWRFPVKSMQGEPIQAEELSAEGLAGDRRFAVGDDLTGRVLSAKREHRLLEAAARTDDGRVVVTFPDGSEELAGDPGADDLLAKWLDRPVHLEEVAAGDQRRFEYHADPLDDASAVFEFACPPGTFLDAAPVHLLTSASLAEGDAHHPQGSWDARRFRPTVLVDVAETGFVEDGWIGARVSIGSAVIAVFAPTLRCAMPMLPQADLARDPDIIRTVARHHQTNLGVYGAVVVSGRVAVGDAVVLQ